MSHSRSSTTSEKNTNAVSSGEINGHKQPSHADQKGSELAAKQFYSNNQITLKNVNTVLTEVINYFVQPGTYII